MKPTIKSKKVMQFVLLLLFAITSVKANKPVHGNGKMKTITEKVADFNSLVLKATYITVEVTNNKMPMIEITTDENILSYIKTSVENKQLTVENPKGIYVIPTQCNIKISTPFLSKLITYREVGKVSISGIDTEEFTANLTDGETTKLILSGKTQIFNLINKYGEVDARQFIANVVKISSETARPVRVNAVKQLEAQLKGIGDFEYEGSPKIVNSNISEYRAAKSKLNTENKNKDDKFVKITFANESANNKEYFVSGFNPRANKHFSYGFSIDAGKKKTEELPIGAKVQANSRFGKNLLTVSKDLENKIIRLN